MKNLTCEHLAEIEEKAVADGVSIAHKGDWWGSGFKRNVYFNCVIDEAQVKRDFPVPEFVVWYEYDGMVAGHEAGFECKQCKSLLVGGHPRYGGAIWPRVG